MRLQPPVRVGYVLKVFPRLSETFILNEITALEQRGVEIHIFSLKPPTDGRFHGQLSRLGAEVTYLPRTDSSAAWRTIQQQYRSVRLQQGHTGAALQRCLESENNADIKHLMQALLVVSGARSRGIDHLHAHFATSSTEVALMAHLLSGISFSFTTHAKDIYHEAADKTLFQDAMQRCSFAVTVTDHNVASLSRKTPWAADKLHRIYNGVDLAVHHPVPEPSGKPPLILSVGRLVEKKGFPYLLQACALLKDRGRDFRCRIVGTGERRAALHEQLEQLQLGDRVELVGALSHERVMEQIHQCCCMVLPCIVGQDGNRDALPTVLLESLALGRPVVSTDLCGVTEIIEDGHTGLLVPQHDSRRLADALGRMLADPVMRSELGAAGRRKAETSFSLSRQAAQLEDLFRSQVESSQPLAACGS